MVRIGTKGDGDKAGIGDDSRARRPRPFMLCSIAVPNKDKLGVNAAKEENEA
jgi:hypothetical protein